MDLGLKGKVALVGASSQGLGRASAESLAREGAAVVMSARRQAELEQAAAEIRSATGAHVVAVAADLASPEGIERALSEAAALGGVDVLVANVGGPPVGGFDALTDEQWLAAFEQVHLSAVRMIRGVLPHMREKGWGRIIGIQSSSVKQPIDNLMLSNGIRPGVAGLFKSLALENARRGVTANLVIPGVILTNRIRTNALARAEKSGVTLEEQLKAMAETIPAGRIGDPSEIGDMVAYLASERAGYITGAVYQVDGGLIRSVV